MRQYGNVKFNNVLDIILNNNILKFTVRKKQLVFKKRKLTAFSYFANFKITVKIIISSL